MEEQVGAGNLWGCSSVGRAPALQAGGQEFESLHLHAILKKDHVRTLKTAYRDSYRQPGDMKHMKAAIDRKIKRILYAAGAAAEKETLTVTLHR